MFHTSKSASKLWTRKYLPQPLALQGWDCWGQAGWDTQGHLHPLPLPDLLSLVLPMVLGGLTMMMKPCQKGLQDPDMNDLLDV